MSKYNILDDMEGCIEYLQDVKKHFEDMEQGTEISSEIVKDIIGIKNEIDGIIEVTKKNCIVQI